MWKQWPLGQTCYTDSAGGSALLSGAHRLAEELHPRHLGTISARLGSMQPDAGRHFAHIAPHQSTPAIAVAQLMRVDVSLDSQRPVFIYRSSLNCDALQSEIVVVVVTNPQ